MARALRSAQPFETTATIINHAGVPHCWFEQSGPEGERLDVLVVRATFDFAVDGSVIALSAQQQPIVYGDAYDSPDPNDVTRAVVVDDGDLLPYKPGTDILVRGAASSPDGKPSMEWLASIRVGMLEKTLRLHGPREFRKTIYGWKLGPTTPVTSVALDYRLAYGGCIDVPAELTADGETATVHFPGNPAGSGWLPRPADYKHLAQRARTHVEKWVDAQNIIAAPQVEAALAPVNHPHANLMAEGFSATARWWMPRVALQGKYDDAWRRTRYPLLPEEFSSRYFQNAAPDMVATPHLLGDETVTLVGLLAQRCEMRLPGWKILVAVKLASGKDLLSMPLLDTLRFDLATRQVSMVWRVHYRFEDPVVDIAIAATTAKFKVRYSK